MSNGDFTGMLTAFLIEPDQTTHDDAHIAHMITLAGPENVVRALTAFSVGKMSSEAGLISAYDGRGRSLESFRIKRMSYERGNVPAAEWSRPTPAEIMPGICEGAAFSRLMDSRYIPTDNPGHSFIITADSPDDLPAAFHNWATLRLPAPMLGEWAGLIYRQGVAQGQITELHSYGMAGALCAWKPEDLQETIRVMGLTGRLKRPDRPAGHAGHAGPATDAGALAMAAD